VVAALALVLAAAACGGSSKGSTATTSGSTTPGSTVHVAKVATNVPSESAKMICSAEALRDINEVIGIKATIPKQPTWINHVYSCDYVYPDGSKMTLSVKEMSNPAETTAYFDSRAQKLGKVQELQGLAQGAFTTKDGSVVTRKDYKVMTVDVSHLPAKFGVPPDTRTNNAINAAFTIMNCWTGA